MVNRLWRGEWFELLRGCELSFGCGGVSVLSYREDLVVIQWSFGCGGVGLMSALSGCELSFGC